MKEVYVIHQMQVNNIYCHNNQHLKSKNNIADNRHGEFGPYSGKSVTDIFAFKYGAHSMAVCHYKSSKCLDKKSFERSRQLKLTAPSTSPIGSPRSPQFSTVLCFTGTIVRECIRETRHRNILAWRGFYLYSCTLLTETRL